MNLDEFIILVKQGKITVLGAQDNAYSKGSRMVPLQWDAEMITAEAYNAGIAANASWDDTLARVKELMQGQ